MAITLHLDQLKQQDVHLTGSLDAPSLDLQLGRDVLVHSAEELDYALDATQADDTLLVRGSLKINFNCDCARCLESFIFTLEMDEWICALPLKGPDAVATNGEHLDLTPWVREDILLGLPQHPHCGEACKGLVYQAD